MRSILAWLTSASILLVVYHLVVYPVVLQIIAGRRQRTLPQVPARRYRESIADRFLPTVAVVVPAFNEAAVIRDKIINLATLDYPSQRIEVVLVCDGCSDLTAEFARAATALPECRHLRLRILEFPVNRGKLAVLNEVLPTVDVELIALSDASALLSVDSLLIAAAHFRDRDIGVVCPSYQLFDQSASAKGESHYWQYQTTIKEREGTIGAVIGAHGAFYMFRRSLFRKLPADTINDDFALPMSIVASGFPAVYDPRMVALELEIFDQRRDWRRRQRIAAGNVQQTIRCLRLLNPKFRETAFAFASGKVVRAILPFLLVMSFFGALALATVSPVFTVLALGQATAYAAAGLRHALPGLKWPKLVVSLHYFVFGQMAGLIGATRYLIGSNRVGWDARKTTRGRNTASFVSHPLLNASPTISHVHPVVRVAKRLMDIATAASLLVITAPVTAMVALAIRLDSAGPIIYRQLRIGESRQDHTKLFFILKFRTMKVDAEATTGATWAAQDDPRETRIGGFLRRARLDELPQLINVLRGEMSLIGPRPERPGFFGQLHQQIPYYCERIIGVRPGITGFAQVYQAGDRTIDDVRTKLFYDHAYALALSRPRAWLALDLRIAGRTILVMLFGTGLFTATPSPLGFQPPQLRDD
jgi:lipopolysaccharide/colanic/teichoic acid biosynthesis glycosyltransferase/cellulose synthase/poly-beta-1,6-N-acetylglucosamine synthase-like glycosyltransferase